MIGFLVGFLLGLWLAVGFFVLVVDPVCGCGDCDYARLARDESSGPSGLLGWLLVAAFVAAAWLDGSVM